MSNITYDATVMKIGYIDSEISNQHIIPGRDCQNFVINEAKKKGVTLTPRPYMKTQRGYVYDVFRASNLIQYTLIGEAKIPEVYPYRVDSKSPNMRLIDGQQRVTTFYYFIHNKFRLHLSKSIFPKFVMDGKEYTTDDLEGKTFSELSQDWQDIILNLDVRMLIHNNCSEAQARSLFYIYSEGIKTLSEIDKRRNLLDEKTLDVLDDILNYRWIYHVMSSAQAGGNAGLDILLQIMTLIHYNGDVSLDKKTINNLISLYKYNIGGIPSKIEENLRNTSKYLSDCFNILIKEKKKADTPETKQKIKNYNLFVYPVFKGKKPLQTSLFWGALRALENDVSEDAFAHWILEFFKNPVDKIPSDLFVKGLGDRTNKSGDQSNVKKRLQAIDEEIAKLSGKSIEDIQKINTNDSGEPESGDSEAKEESTDKPEESKAE